MKIFILQIAFITGGLFALAAAPTLNKGPDPTAKLKLPQKRFACPFICLHFVRSGMHGIIYEGHESYELFITGNKFEDDFEKRVLEKANISCKGGNAAKLVDFNSQDYVMADGLGNTKSFKQVTTIKSFSPASHCIEDTQPNPKK